MGPPLEYMCNHQVFEGIQSDIYDLWWFYILETTGDPPKFSTPQEPTAHTIGWPYLILVHSADSVMAVLLLRELHTAMCLCQLQVNLWDKLVKLSFCPFCTYVGGGGNDLSYLNHIIIAHYNVSYGCG